MPWGWALQWLWCAVIGAGTHMTMVAMVDNASVIVKSFVKSFINGIIVVQTNLMFHTLNPSCSHGENLRLV